MILGTRLWWITVRALSGAMAIRVDSELFDTFDTFFSLLRQRLGVDKQLNKWGKTRRGGEGIIDVEPRPLYI